MFAEGYLQEGSPGLGTRVLLTVYYYSIYFITYCLVLVSKNTPFIIEVAYCQVMLRDLLSPCD